MVKVNKAKRGECMAAATISNKADKPMASSRVARPTVRDNMVKDKATVVSNNQATASQDMSMLAPPLHMPTFSLTALLLVSKLKATVDQAEPRKAIAAS